MSLEQPGSFQPQVDWAAPTDGGGRSEVSLKKEVFGALTPLAQALNREKYLEESGARVLSYLKRSITDITPEETALLNGALEQNHQRVYEGSLQGIAGRLTVNPDKLFEETPTAKGEAVKADKLTPALKPVYEATSKIITEKFPNAINQFNFFAEALRSAIDNGTPQNADLLFQIGARSFVRLCEFAKEKGLDPAKISFSGLTARLNLLQDQRLIQSLEKDIAITATQSEFIVVGDTAIAIANTARAGKQEAIGAQKTAEGKTATLEQQLKEAQEQLAEANKHIEELEIVAGSGTAGFDLNIGIGRATPTTSPSQAKPTAADL